MRPGDPPFYILDDLGRPMGVWDVLVWGHWFEDTEQRRVASDRIFTPGGEEVYISTVFLGIDHRFWGNGPPLLWETMIFGGVDHEEQRRYSSLEDAKAGHAECVAMVQAAISAVEEITQVKPEVPNNDDGSPGSSGSDR